MLAIPYVDDTDVARWADSNDRLGERLSNSIQAGQIRKGHTIASRISIDICAAAVSYVRGDMAATRSHFNEALDTFQLFFAPRFAG